MNDWYNNTNDNWYEPMEVQAAAPRQAAPAPKPKKKRRWLYISVVCLIFAAVGFFLAFGDLFVNDIPESNFDVIDEFPDDFHDYLDNFYITTTGTPADVRLPEMSERGSLTLNVVDGSGSELELPELFVKCSPSIVYVKATQKNAMSYSWGSGIIVSEDGYILTNTHVIEQCDAVEIGLTDGSYYDAQLVGYDGTTDLAVLKIEAEGLTPASFCTEAVIGEEVAAIGNPLGESYRLTLTNGIISATNRSVNRNGSNMNLLQTNAAINEGNSGGALFNSRGQVLGITNMKMVSTGGVEGIGFAIPTETILTIVSAIMDKGAVYGRATIGITVGAIPEEVAEQYDIPMGLYVSNVTKGSDAAKQGVKYGDILTAINGTPVETTEDVAAVKAELEIGDVMHFNIWRDGQELEFDVKLMDAIDIEKAN